jgi:predicted NAD-dependent protein-ADP-ribosyltransferase YbiA (DUF1768 family)
MQIKHVSACTVRELSKTLVLEEVEYSLLKRASGALRWSTDEKSALLNMNVDTVNIQTGSRMLEVQVRTMCHARAVTADYMTFEERFNMRTCILVVADVGAVPAAWAQLLHPAMALFLGGCNVIIVEVPGFNSDPLRWITHGPQIIVGVLKHFSILRVQALACGSGGAVFLKALTEAPERFGKTHFIYNMDTPPLKYVPFDTNALEEYCRAYNLQLWFGYADELDVYNHREGMAAQGYDAMFKLQTRLQGEKKRGMSKVDKTKYDEILISESINSDHIERVQRLQLGLNNFFIFADDLNTALLEHFEGVPKMTQDEIGTGIVSERSASKQAGATALEDRLPELTAITKTRNHTVKVRQRAAQNNRLRLELIDAAQEPFLPALRDAARTPASSSTRTSSKARRDSRNSNASSDGLRGSITSGSELERAKSSGSLLKDVAAIKDGPVPFSLCDLFFKGQKPSAPHKLKFIDEQGVERLFQKRKDDTIVDLSSCGRVILTNVDILGIDGREIRVRGKTAPDWDGPAEMTTVVPRSKEFMIAKLLGLFTNDQLVNAFNEDDTENLNLTPRSRQQSKESCVKTVDTAYGGKQLGTPMLQAVTFDDPRADGQRKAGVVAFSHTGKDDPCDTLCCAPFLGNQWELGQGYIKLDASSLPGKIYWFSNAETAFQALQFWTFAEEFEDLAGYDLVRQMKKLRGKEDSTFAGYGSNWNGMLAVLRLKFYHGSVCGEALKNTGGAFLLSHNSASGREAIWSDNNKGDGTNWLGLQLMLIRDELIKDQQNNTPTWTQHIDVFFDTAKGKPRDERGMAAWQTLVKQATMAVKEVLDEAADCVVDAEDSDENSSSASAGSPAPEAGTLAAPAAQVAGASSTEDGGSAARAASPELNSAPSVQKVEFIDEDGETNTFVCNATGGVNFIAAGDPALRDIRIKSVEGRTICFSGIPFEGWEGDDELESEVPEGQEALVKKVLAMLPVGNS